MIINEDQKKTKENLKIQSIFEVSILRNENSVHNEKDVVMSALVLIKIMIHDTNDDDAKLIQGIIRLNKKKAQC